MSATKTEARTTASGLPPKPAARLHNKKVWNSSMKLVRRVHLYSGIFMFPFVLLYGITGWMFNHPGYFNEGESTSFVGSEVADGKLSELASPAAMAADVVASINDQSPDGPKIVLTEARPPEYSGFMSFSAKGEDASHSIRLNPVTGDGEVRSQPIEETEKQREAERLANNPLSSIKKTEVTVNGFEEAKAALPAVLSELGIDVGEVKAGRRSPSLLFSAEVDGVPTVVSYSLGNGAVSAVREDSVPEVKTKSFLLRMHKSRTYSPDFNIRWFWALLVDGMVISMVFWGLSGMIMWWQIKRTRLLGGGFLVASLVCTTLLVVGMHDNNSVSSGLRNSRPRQERSRQSESDKKQPAKATKAQKQTDA
ncbi:MAG: hypothetical protein AB8G99_02280 [Planctomycetaceae bacterium]